MFSTGKPRGKPAAGAKKKLKHGGASMSNLAALYGGQETGKEVTEQDKHEELMRKRRNYLQVSANKDRQLFQEKMLQSGNTAFNSMRNDSKDSSSQNETLPLTLEQELDYADTTELRELFEATDAAMAQDDILRRLQTGLPLGEYQTIYIKDVVEEGVKHMRSTKPRNWAEYLYGRERAGMRANMYMPGSAASGQQQQLQGLHPAHHHSPERQSTIPPIGPGSASNVLKDLIGGASQADQALSQMNVFMQTHVDTMDSIETLLSELNEGASSRGTGRETPQRPSLKIPRSAARESGGLNDGFDNMNKAGTSRGQKAVGWNLEPHRFRLDVEMGHFTMKKPPRHQSRLSHRKIWTAFDPSENIQACVKGEPHNLPRDESVLHKEARILARLQEDEDQPGIPYMYAFGLNEISKQYLLVTELLGPNLEQLFAHEIVGRKEAYGFDTKTVLGIGLQALRALSYVHKCNILHRAVKPSNFAVGNVTNVWNKKLIYLLDYGWAKDLGPVVEAQREKDRTENIKKEGELLKRRGGGASQQEQKSNAGTSIVDGGPTGDPVDGPPQNQFVELPNIADWPRYREVAKRTKKSFHADDDLIAVTKDLPYNNHVLFASPQAHRNQLNATWRDDYCALGYMMVYWLSGGSLPWSDRISEENLFPESARFLNLKAKAKRESERKHLHHHRGHSAGSDGSRGNKGAGSEQSDSFSTTSDDRNNLDEDLDLPNNNLTHEDDENDLVTPDIFRTASAVCFAPNLRDKDDQPPTWPLPLQQQMRGDRIRAKEVLTLVTRRRVLQEIEAAKTSTTWTKVCQPVPGKKMRAKFIEFFRYVYEGRAISSTIDMGGHDSDDSSSENKGSVDSGGGGRIVNWAQLLPIVNCDSPWTMHAEQHAFDCNVRVKHDTEKLERYLLEMAEGTEMDLSQPGFCWDDDYHGPAHAKQRRPKVLEKKTFPKQTFPSYVQRACVLRHDQMHGRVHRVLDWERELGEAEEAAWNKHLALIQKWAQAKTPALAFSMQKRSNPVKRKSLVPLKRQTDLTTSFQAFRDSLYVPLEMRQSYYESQQAAAAEAAAEKAAADAAAAQAETENS